MGWLILEEDLFVKRNIINPFSPEGRRIHNFLLERAKLLVGDKVDFDKTPVMFVMSDVDDINAFHVKAAQDQGYLRRDEY